MLQNRIHKNDSLPQSAGAAVGADRWIVLVAAYLLIALMLRWPEIAVRAAGKAMDQWYHSVVPALLPFMMLMPLITSREAAYVYERMLGKVMPFLFGLPGSVAPAIVTAIVAGSPAGAIASARIAEQTGMDKKQLLRITGCMCGLSPAFLISGIGLGMMGDINAGVMLFKTQILTQMIMLLSSRGFMGEERICASADNDKVVNQPFAPVLTVAGYMVFWSVCAAFISEFAGEGKFEYMICLLEVTAGADLIANTAAEPRVRMIVLAMICGFGGISIVSQIMKILEKYQIKAIEYLKWRVVGSLTAGVIMGVQLLLGSGKQYSTEIKWLEIASFSAILLVIPLIFVFNNTFLNKRNF